MHRQLWLIIACTAIRVTTTLLMSKHTASRVYSISLHSVWRVTPMTTTTLNVLKHSRNM